MYAPRISEKRIALKQLNEMPCSIQIPYNLQEL